jgi:hypothetical protein
VTERCSLLEGSRMEKVESRESGPFRHKETVYTHRTVPSVCLLVFVTSVLPLVCSFCNWSQNNFTAVVLVLEPPFICCHVGHH